jgi:hypothetical protein
MRKKKLTDGDILMEIYRNVYAVAEPPANFDELMANAEINKEGQKVIKFMDYECEEAVMQRILDETMDKYKVKDYRRKQFSFSFWLGCSPKTKKVL